MELAYGWPAGVIIGAVATRAFLYIPKYWIYSWKYDQERNRKALKQLQDKIFMNDIKEDAKLYNWNFRQYLSARNFFGTRALCYYGLSGYIVLGYFRSLSYVLHHNSSYPFINESY